MKTQHLFSAVVMLALGVACGVEVGIDGKQCSSGKCGDGYVCDTTKNLCVEPSQLTVAPPPVKAACDPCSCATDADCKDPTRPSCGPNKVCVQCVAGPGDKCAAGTYCNAKNQCTIGCRSNDDCSKLSATSPFCQLDRHQCVTCLTSDACGGKTCTPSGTCATACNPAANNCLGGQACCGGLCIDVATDVLNCGKCNTACTAENGTPKCVSGGCNADCADGFATCGTSGTCLTEVRTDPNNCGQCGVVCAALPHVLNSSCTQSVCRFACADGWLNTNNLPADGCEAQCGNVAGADCCPGDKCFGPGLSCNTGNHRCKTGGPG